ncbi:hypothetical protein AB7008_09615 [Bradyrhizobium sp. 521_C7_N1_3]|uniref:hypothetical protein n=1 Tax=Bradyrhizobium sp. 521_C7_N1_3 TaxID=3240368 RepID=UPI003F8B3499
MGQDKSSAAENLADTHLIELAAAIVSFPIVDREPRSELSGEQVSMQPLVQFG